MKLYCLSNLANKPCNVITFKNCTLMLDCGLDMTSVGNFLPLPLVTSQKFNNLNSWVPRDADSQLEGELKECMTRLFIDSPPEVKPPNSGLVDFSQIDAILVSNYLNMLALPYITNNTGFRGTILLTEPTLQIGQLLMEELVEFIERTPKAKHATRWKNFLKFLPLPLSDVKSPRMWQTVYNKKAYKSALTHCQILAYHQKVNICGAIEVTAVSSGFCLGSCNWIIQSDHEKISYLSGSSSLTTHPRPIDQSALKSADVLLMASLNHTPIYNPDNMLAEFCVAVATTVRNDGNALVPCYPSGVVYDLFECLSEHLDKMNLPYVPMYFVSPVADSSLAYSNIFSEWLSIGKETKVYQMEDPFPHANLTRIGRLKAFKSLHAEGFSTEYRQPCIVFCGHPSLRFGDVIHFIEMWGNNAQNAILFTEPEFDFVEALAPFQPLSMRPIYCPIDTSLNYNQARKLITDLKPKKVVLPEVYLHPPVSAPHRTEFVMDLQDPPLTYRECEVINLGLDRKLEKATLSSELAMSLNPTVIRSGLNAATITANLVIKDNRCELKAMSEDKSQQTLNVPTKYPFGRVSGDDMMQKLRLAGYSDAKLDDDPGGFIITLDAEGAMIQVKDYSTHIIVSNNDALREKLGNIFFECTSHF